MAIYKFRLAPPPVFRHSLRATRQHALRTNDMQSHTMPSQFYADESDPTPRNNHMMANSLVPLMTTPPAHARKRIYLYYYWHLTIHLILRDETNLGERLLDRAGHHQKLGLVGDVALHQVLFRRRDTMPQYHRMQEEAGGRAWQERA